MAIVSIDLDLHEFSKNDIARHVAADDALWALCVAERDRVLSRPAGTHVSHSAWVAAERDGLIKAAVPV